MLPKSNKQDFAGCFELLPKPPVLSGEQDDVLGSQSALVFPIPAPTSKYHSPEPLKSAVPSLILGLTKELCSSWINPDGDLF